MRAHYIEILKKQFDIISPLTEEAWGDFTALCKVISMDKGTTWIREGQRTEDVLFIVEGVMRTFYRNKEGIDYNKTFFMDKRFATPIAALIQKQPSHLYFESLLPIKGLTFNFYQFLDLFDKHRSLERLYRKIIEYEWVVKKEQREINFVLQNATERYAYFQNEYPGLENLIPQYHIASHLGITPIQLSRIRAKLSQH